MELANGYVIMFGWLLHGLRGWLLHGLRGVSKMDARDVVLVSGKGSLCLKPRHAQTLGYRDRNRCMF